MTTSSSETAGVPPANDGMAFNAPANHCPSFQSGRVNLLLEAGETPAVPVKSGLHFRWRAVSVLAFIILLSLAGLACSTNLGSKSVPPDVESTINTLGDEINAERYDKIYNEASEQWRQSSTLEEATANFKTLRTKLGPVENRTLLSATEQQNSGSALKGRAYIVSYRTKFQNGEGMETFTLVEKDGRWQLARYFVNSTALK